MSEIIIKDERNAARDGQGFAWHWAAASRCTAAMLIEERIRVEMDRIRDGRTASAFYQEIGGREEVLVDKLVAHALQAFSRGRLVLIVNDRQVIGAETEIDIGERLEVVFVRLLPLKAG